MKATPAPRHPFTARRRIIFRMASMNPDWATTLAIALIASFFTVCFIEPIRVLVQRWLRRREMRRMLYQEMVLNFRALDGQVELAKHDAEMKEGLGYRFGRSFKRSAFEVAQHEPQTYYGLDDSERY